MPTQLTLDWGARPAFGRDDFFVSASNAAVVAMVEAPQSWPQNKLIIVGPQGAGKTHLVRVWAHQCKAHEITRETLGTVLPSGPAFVENVETLMDEDAQEALFHLHNHCQSLGYPFLLTSHCLPGVWAMTLPDLKSRIHATTQVEIGMPDDALLAAVLVKLLADRQLVPEPDALRYLLPRIERSFSTLAPLAKALDQCALADGRRITRPVAAKVLADFSG